MKKNYILFLLVVATSFTWQTKAQNGGDNCASAVEISEGSVTQTQINDVSGGANGGDAATTSKNKI